MKAACVQTTHLETVPQRGPAERIFVCAAKTRCLPWINLVRGTVGTRSVAKSDVVPPLNLGRSQEIYQKKSTLAAVKWVQCLRTRLQFSCLGKVR